MAITPGPHGSSHAVIVCSARCSRYWWRWHQRAPAHDAKSATCPESCQANLSAIGGGVTGTPALEQVYIVQRTMVDLARCWPWLPAYSLRTHKLRKHVRWCLRCLQMWQCRLPGPIKPRRVSKEPPLSKNYSYFFLTLSREETTHSSLHF